MLQVAEQHNETYNSWCISNRKRRWDAAEERAGLLIDRLGANMTLSLRFPRCDSETGSKQPDSARWFVELERGIEVLPDVAEH